MPENKKEKLRWGPTSYTTARYDTPEAAAAAASSIFNPLSIEDDREVGGAVVLEKHTGKYYFSYTLGDPGAGTVNIAVMRRPEDQVLGLWHTHGNKGIAREYFSAGDVKIAKDLGLPLYMTDYKGNLRVVTDKSPTKRIMYREGREFINKAGVSEGEVVTDPQTGEPIVLRVKREEPIVQPGQLKFPRIQ